MKEVWVAADTIISPLGSTTADNFQRVIAGIGGLRKTNIASLSTNSIVAGRIDSIKPTIGQSRFETLCLQAIAGILEQVFIPAERSVFILSTTKGNIDLLNNPTPGCERIHLHQVADFLSAKLEIKKSIVISNACISGVMAMIVGRRFLQSGKFDHALIVGADELSSFVISGFGSLHALSDEPCKPFDASRKGINLGEAAAAIVLTTKPDALGIQSSIHVLGSGLSNDANHISGPSRTGDELSSAIGNALAESNLGVRDIDFISAHGTATVYNDEMEAKAFSSAGFTHTPVQSLKGFYGHTLGAAGVVETIIGIESLRHNLIAPTLGFENAGVSTPIQVFNRTINKPLRTFLKTASGFGGCNAAIVFQKKQLL